MTQPLRHICGEIIHHNEGGYHSRFDRDCSGPAILSCPNCPYPLEEGWFQALYFVEPMTRGMMERTTSGRYCCSNCWGYGMIVEDVPPEDDSENQETLYRVLCAECLEETRGFVSSGYVGRARELDWRNHVLVQATLGPVFGVVSERRSIADCLSDLGFGL